MNQISNLSSENSSNLYRNRKHIRRQTDAFASESLDFLDGKNLGEVDIYRVSSDTRGKVRRIIEKRIAQEMAKSERYFGASNYSRYHEKHRTANQIKNIFGEFQNCSEFAA